MNVNINNNFKNSINWSTNQRHWGYNPWWNRPAHYPWYGGSWRCGWVRPPIYYPPRFPGYYPAVRPGEAVAWGLAAWGLGNLIFDCGYSSYRNPYPPAPIVIQGGSSVTYTQPITVVASAAPAPVQETSNESIPVSDLMINQSIEEFRSGNYMASLESVNKAIAELPGDGAFHEFRALILFALGQYGEAAGVLNPLLASSPGWDWSTMIQFYGNPEDYTTQLRKLEGYAGENADSAPAQFLLGYHYMVGTALDEAAVAFARAAELVPADRVAAQMAQLAGASTTAGDAEAPDAEVAMEGETAPAPVALEQLIGQWTSNNGENGIVSLSLDDSGEFIWKFESAGSDPFEMKGQFNLGQANVLTLDGGDSQMAGTVSLGENGEMSFVLAGGPPGDPGLLFEKG